MKNNSIHVMNTAITALYIQKQEIAWEWNKQVKKDASRISFADTTIQKFSKALEFVQLCIGKSVTV